MFAAFLSPLSALPPPVVKSIWEVVSIIAVVLAGHLSLRIFQGFKTRLFFLLMIFVMPFQLLLYTEQSLPQYWLPPRFTMWLSPVYFVEYYWGNTNS
jgi:sugar phosphate permease